MAQARGAISTRLSSVSTARKVILPLTSNLSSGGLEWAHRAGRKKGGAVAPPLS